MPCARAAVVDNTAQTLASREYILVGSPEPGKWEDVNRAGGWGMEAVSKRRIE